MGFDLGGGGNAFSFDKVGDSVTGKVLGVEEQQQTDMDTGRPAVWDNGAPKMMYRVELRTDLRDDMSDDGRRAVYLRGSRKPESKSSLAAVLAAVREATGGTNIDPGGVLTLTFVGEGVQTRRGFNPPKQYEASYRPPSVNLGGEAGSEQPPWSEPPAAPAASPAGPTPEQIAALRAAHVDPATVFPNLS